MSVLWDVDGTLADTESFGHRKAFNLAFNDFNLDWFWDENEYVQLLSISGGLNRIKFYSDKIKNKLSDDFALKIQQRKQYHYKVLINNGSISLRIGVDRLLRELYRANINQYIVTTSSINSLMPLIKSVEYLDYSYFSGFITYEDVNRHKPFPDAYKLALKRYGINRDNCLVIEDSQIGLRSAYKANLNCLVTLSPWISTINDEFSCAKSVVNHLGDDLSDSTILKGPYCNTGFITLEYLTKLLNC